MSFPVIAESSLWKLITLNVNIFLKKNTICYMNNKEKASEM